MNDIHNDNTELPVVEAPALAPVNVDDLADNHIVLGTAIDGKVLSIVDTSGETPEVIGYIQQTDTPATAD